MTAFAPRPAITWQLRTRTLALGPRTLLMGILNITPDSFSDGNYFNAPTAAVDHGLRLLDEGADLLDLGAESTRPNATPVNPATEQERLLPVLRALRKLRPEAVISIDTYHAATARAALDEGVEIINDVSGLLWDRDMAGVLAAERPGAILMHTRGAPRMWATLPPLPHEEVLPLVLSGLTHTLTLASDAGIPPATVVLDPGFGFGKRLDENFVLLRQFAALGQFGLPLLGAISRKRFLVAHIPHPTLTNRLETTCAGNVALILAGAHLLRVHDIHAARTAADTADAILRGGGVQPSF